MLTMDLDRLGIGPGMRVLDLGCGGGRHAFEVYRRGADVVALDQNVDDLRSVQEMFDAMALEGEVPAGATATTVEGDALALPFADGEFDVVIASEILEHIPDDTVAMAELTRVVRPGGTVAVSVPRWLPEKVCWALSDAYHEVEGGHIRIYERSQLVQRLESAGLQLVGSHHAHALHSPYWWIKCAVGVNNDDAFLPRQYHKLLVWDIMKRPLATRLAEAALNPLIGKSLVLYFEKPDADS